MDITFWIITLITILIIVLGVLQILLVKKIIDVSIKSINESRLIDRSITKPLIILSLIPIIGMLLLIIMLMFSYINKIINNINLNITNYKEKIKVILNHIELRDKQ